MSLNNEEVVCVPNELRGGVDAQWRPAPVRMGDVVLVAGIHNTNGRRVYLRCANAEQPRLSYVDSPSSATRFVIDPAAQRVGDPIRASVDEFWLRVARSQPPFNRRYREGRDSWTEGRPCNEGWFVRYDVPTGNLLLSSGQGIKLVAQLPFISSRQDRQDVDAFSFNNFNTAFGRRRRPRTSLIQYGQPLRLRSLALENNVSCTSTPGTLNICRIAKEGNGGENDAIQSFVFECPPRGGIKYIRPTPDEPPIDNRIPPYPYPLPYDSNLERRQRAYNAQLAAEREQLELQAERARLEAARRQLQEEQEQEQAEAEGEAKEEAQQRLEEEARQRQEQEEQQQRLEGEEAAARQRQEEEEKGVSTQTWLIVIASIALGLLLIGIILLVVYLMRQNKQTTGGTNVTTRAQRTTTSEEVNF